MGGNWTLMQRQVLLVILSTIFVLGTGLLGLFFVDQLGQSSQRLAKETAPKEREMANLKTAVLQATLILRDIVNESIHDEKRHAEKLKEYNLQFSEAQRSVEFLNEKTDARKVIDLTKLSGVLIRFQERGSQVLRVSQELELSSNNYSKAVRAFNGSLDQSLVTLKKTESIVRKAAIQNKGEKDTNNTLNLIVVSNIGSQYFGFQRKIQILGTLTLESEIDALFDDFGDLEDELDSNFEALKEGLSQLESSDKKEQTKTFDLILDLSRQIEALKQRSLRCFQLKRSALTSKAAVEKALELQGSTTKTMNDMIAKGEKYIVAEMNQSVENVEQVYQTSIFMTIGVVVLGVVLSFLLSGFISQSIARPLTAITRQLVVLSQGKTPPTKEELVTRLDVDAQNEIGDLSRAVVDINEQLQGVIKQVEIHSRLKTDFLANMSHEIRTPINGVIGMVNLLNGTSLDSEQTEFAAIAQNSANALLSLVNDILDFSKIEAGKLELEYVPFSLQSITEEVADILASKAFDKSLEIAVHYPVSIPSYFIGDPNRLRQILLNLLSNAVKFTDSGEVVLRVMSMEEGKDETTLQIEVQDTGIGMTTEQVGNLFQSFVQADVSTTRKFGGTGLGLAISKNLVEAMNGTITVDSHEGIGTTFKIVIKLRRHDDPSDLQELSPMDFSQCRILIVDDRKTNRTILEHYLKSWGCPTDLADSGEEAIRKIAAAEAGHTAYKFVLIDYKLSDMSGIDVATKIYETEDKCRSRFILISSLPEKSNNADLVRDRFAACLTKPVKRSALFNLMSTLAVSESTQAKLKDPDQSASPPKIDTREGRLLLVEDHPINRKLMNQLLKRRGIPSYGVAKHGQEAIDLFRENSYDLILMDCQMPVLDGYQATEAIRSLEIERGQDRTPIVAMTANALKGDRDQCLKVGMDDYITKPIQEKEIDRILEEYLPKLESSVEPLNDKQGLSIEQAALKALVVEDNPTNRMIVRSLLLKNQIDYDEAENGAVAVNKSDLKRYDIILMDCQMPVLDGYAATEIIRAKSHENKETPILAVTANVIKGNKDRCLAAGMNGFLSKPFDEEGLIESIHELVGNQRLKTPDSTDVLFSPAVLEKLVPNDLALQKEILNSFMMEFIEFVDSLTPWPETLPEDIRTSCHSLKGLTGSIGMSRLEKRMETLEAQFRENALELAEQTFEHCLSDWEKAAPLLGTFLDS
ncbi:MAG: response regulator [Planctomycetota bacterium]|nr:response regulator [Planctomycetota bacterium]